MAVALAGFLGGRAIPASANYRCTGDFLFGEPHNCKIHWHTHHQHWHFGPSLDGSPKREAVRRSAAVWNDTSSEFYFYEDAAADNHVGEHDIAPEADGSRSRAEAHLVWSKDSNHFIDRDIHFNTYFNGEWNNAVDSCPNGENYDTLAIAIHERGHALGLSHWPYHDTSPLPTMHPGHYPKCWGRTLTESDKDGQRAVYDNSPGD